MTSQFKVISVFARSFNEGIIETLNQLLKFLGKFDAEVCLEATTAETLGLKQYPIVEKNYLGRNADLVIVVGGDGSLLNAARNIVDDKVRVLGINRGNLGFLTDIMPNDLETKLKEILTGSYQDEERFLLSASIGGNPSSYALNEVVLMPEKAPHLIEFDIFIDDQFVCQQRSDGLIVATPTGSTAYALSGGGPILHPQLDAIALVPMFPHTLSMRPIVVTGNSSVRLKLNPNNSSTVMLCCDGQDPVPVHPEQEVVIQKKPSPLRLIHPVGHDYYEALRSKLHWAAKPIRGQ